MLISLTTLLTNLSSIFRSRAALELENLALRHQIGVLRRAAAKRLKLTSADRLLWICLSRLWRGWRSALTIVKPETVIAWHRAGFRLFWTWKVRCGQPGRPVISPEIRALIRKMCRENPSWGAPRIHGELLKLGFNVGESSVSKYMVRSRKPPSQTWRTFLEIHAKQLVSIDFFTVPTIRFQVLYVFLVLAHDRRREALVASRWRVFSLWQWLGFHCFQFRMESRIHSRRRAGQNHSPGSDIVRVEVK
jgi:putative transposase